MTTAYAHRTFNPSSSPSGHARYAEPQARTPQNDSRGSGQHTQRTTTGRTRRRRGYSCPLCLDRNFMFVSGFSFALVMVYVFLYAATLATAFRGRQVDGAIYDVQSGIHRNFSRFAVITSPDVARQTAASRGLQKVTSDQIDDLTVPVPKHYAGSQGSPSDRPVRVVLVPSAQPTFPNP